MNEDTAYKIIEAQAQVVWADKEYDHKKILAFRYNIDKETGLFIELLRRIS